MGEIAKLLSDVPTRLRAQLSSGTVEGAKILTAELQQTLGVQGTRRNPSRPGEPARKQTGRLQRETRAVADPQDLSISIQTTAYGSVLNLGNRAGTLAARPWLKAALDSARPAFRAAVFGRK